MSGQLDNFANSPTQEERPFFLPLKRQLQLQLYGSLCSGALGTLIIVNLWVLYGRPQDLVPILGASKLPLILSLLPLPFVLFDFQRLWRSSVQVRGMLLLFVLGGVWVPFAINNYWAFQTWRDVAAQFFCFLFPVVLYMGTGPSLRKIAIMLSFVSICLGGWALTHSGRGPGGFAGDENDLGLAVLAILGMPLMLVPRAQTMFSRILYTVAIAFSLGGIVATSSRGTFVGLVVLLLYAWSKSSTKIVTTVLAGVIVLAGVMLAPKAYWERISTIQQTNQGSAYERRQIWSVALRVWLTPEHFFFGTGMSNTPYWLGRFEPKTNQGSFGKSIAGRAVHSSFIQLLSDLGIVGLLIVGSVLWASFFGNNWEIKRIGKCSEALRAALFKLRHSGGVPLKMRDSTEVVEGKEAQQLLAAGMEELRFMTAFLSGLNVCWVGAIAASFFISVLYYPPFWLLAVCTVAAQSHTATVRFGLSELIDRIDFTNPSPRKL